MDAIGITRTFAYNSKFPENMFEFQQYLGFLMFLTIFTMGFWLMIFLIHFVFYWLFGATRELYLERKAKREQELEAGSM